MNSSKNTNTTIDKDLLYLVRCHCAKHKLKIKDYLTDLIKKDLNILEKK